MKKLNVNGNLPENNEKQKKPKLMINVTDKIKQNKNRQYRNHEYYD